MIAFLPTIILRHRKENLKKCSLEGLRDRNDLQFLTYPHDPVPFLQSYILLTLDAPPLTQQDCASGLFILDATWRYAAVMERQISQREQWICRSLPSTFQTSYPRKQADCPDPERGLASVEALYISYHILGRKTEGLLDHYYWKNDFLKKNQERLKETSPLI